VLLDHCIKQLQAQTYPVDHHVFLNGPDDELESLRALASHLIAENPHPRPPVIRFGPTGRLHDLYVSALRSVDLDAYDLFLWVDDDDYYRRRYVENCVADFELNRWDFSGAHSHGAIIDGQWLGDLIWDGLGRNDRDLALGIPDMMPPTYAFSRRAIDVTMALSDDGVSWVDAQWRWALYEDPTIRTAVRDQTDFSYHRHGANASLP
jgi:hypothetical protein